jgi:hypothetical protein
VRSSDAYFGSRFRELRESLGIVEKKPLSLTDEEFDDVKANTNAVGRPTGFRARAASPLVEVDLDGDLPTEDPLAI